MFRDYNRYGSYYPIFKLKGRTSFYFTCSVTQLFFCGRKRVLHVHMIIIIIIAIVLQMQQCIHYYTGEELEHILDR